MIPIYLWLVFFFRRFATLLLAVIKPVLEREYVQYRTPSRTLNSLRNRYFSGTYLEAMQLLTHRSKQRLCICFITSDQAFGDPEPPLEDDDGSLYFAVVVDEYHGFLLARKFLVSKVPCTLIVSMSEASSPVVKQRLEGVILQFDSGRATVRRPKSPRIVISPVSKKSLVEEQNEAYQRTTHADVMRQRRVNFEKRLPGIASEYVISDGSFSEAAFKIAIQLPNATRRIVVFKRDAPVAAVVAVVKDALPEGASFLVKSIDPVLNWPFGRDECHYDELLQTRLCDCNISPLQKMFVEYD
jgi:hypothetical protein